MSKSLATGFNRLAPIYDALARVAIGKGIRTSQLHFLNHLRERRKLLILGGGTGWILPYIIKSNPTIQIDYVDISHRMIEQARSNVSADFQVRFIVGTEENIPDKNYDCVITNFYLDLFDDANLGHAVFCIKNSILPNAIWVATDFIDEIPWHRRVLAIMYWFFRVTTGLRTKKLPLWEKELRKAGGTQLEMAKYSRSFIKSVVFRFPI